MGSRSCLAGMEVPIIGSDSIEWFQVSVPSSLSPPSTSEFTSVDTFTKDLGSCSVIGSPPNSKYLFWKIAKSQPNVLDILEVYSSEKFPQFGLRILFPDALLPFAHICRDEMGSKNHYVLYTLTISGVAYLIRLKSVDSYGNCSILGSNDVVEYNTQMNTHFGAITAVAASSGGLVVGRNDGSVSCIQLGLLNPDSPGFSHELRDDTGFGRLWGMMSRGRTTAAVQDLIVLEVHQKKFLFVLHSDGIFRVWDTASHTKILSHSISIPTTTGTTFLKIWMGDPDGKRNSIPFAVLHNDTLGVNANVISFYAVNYGIGDRMSFTVEPLMLSISLDEGGPIDVRLTLDKVWILKDSGLVVHELFANKGVAQSYALQEAFIADQLFLSSGHSSDDILWLSHAVFPSSKDQISEIVSSILLRRLLLPGVYHPIALRTTLQEYNKHFTDSEYNSFTVDGLKNELLSLIEHEGVYESPVSVLHFWKSFCAQYCTNWCKINAACGLFVDSSTGAVSFIRKNLFSVCRLLEDIELFVYGSVDELGDTFSVPDFPTGLERDILFEVLQCISSVNQHLGKAASAIFYESLHKTPTMSSEEVLPRLLKVLEIGYSSSIATLHMSELGADVVWEKETLFHKNLRKFSIELFLSLHSLCSRATSWGKVLDVIESYLRLLVTRKISCEVDFQACPNIFVPVTVQATSQVAKVMFESALDVLVLLSYMVNISGQIQMSHADVSRIRLEIIPLIQETITEWHIIHFVVTTPTESPAFEDFSSQLSSLQIDGSIDRRSLNEKLGKCDFTLGFVLLLSLQSSSQEQANLSSIHLPNPSNVLTLVREFTSWIIRGRTGEESSFFFIHSIDLAFIFLRYSQYNAMQYLLTLVDVHSRKEKICESVQNDEGKWSMVLHLLGCCLIAQAQVGLHGSLRDKKVSEAIRCFYRAASMQGAPDALQSLSHEAGWARLGFSGCRSSASWKLHYYQWVMQMFEQYNLSEAACQFAITALEQVEEALGSTDGSVVADPHGESATAVKGRLWANVFKFALDLNYYYDAYCALISNPDEESKSICLRRFIIVLYERGAIKILCNGQLPFIGLLEKVEQELAWKAERSYISSKPNPFKLLYAFEMHRHNWRKAAKFMYMYSSQLRTEVATKDHQNRSLVLQERLNGLSAAINALQLVHPAYAWIDSLPAESTFSKDDYPSKKARITMQDQSPDDDGPRKIHSCLEIEKLENEYILTSAEYLLSLGNIKWTFTGHDKPPSYLVDLLVESNLYDMAFTVVLRFWQHSGLKRELERVFTSMSLKCCPNEQTASSFGSQRIQGFLLNSSQKDEGFFDIGHTPQQSKGNSQWETLEIYLEKYRGYHPRLPIVVAETLLASDPRIELPLWLVKMFKGVRQESCFGMSGSESNPASLFCLYVNYGRFVEATNLLLEYIESLASLKPTDVICRKRPCSIWFPYTSVERLWLQLEESIRLGHMIDQCEKLKRLLQGALLKHLNLVKVDSDDVQCSAMH